MQVPHERSPDLVIRFRGVLDCDTARALLQTADALPDGAGFVLDISEARDADDTAVAFLASGLSETSRPYLLRGLSIHQERLLRYLELPFESEAK